MSTAQQAKPLSALVAAHAGEAPQDVLNLVLAEAEKRLAEPPAEVRFGPHGMEAANFAGLWKIGTLYSRSSMVPDHYKGRVDDCAIAAELAMRLGIPAMMLMQSTFIVHGKPGMEAKMQIALANDRKVFKGPIRFDLSGEGMNRKCTAFAFDRETGTKCEQMVTMQMAKAEGWIDKSGSKWKSIPDLMLQYRAAAWLIRTHCPEVVMGMMTREELEDIEGPQTPAKAHGRLTELVTGLEIEAGNGEPPQEEPKTATDAGQAADTSAGCNQATQQLSEFDAPDFGEAIPAEEPIADADQQAAEQAQLVAEYSGKAEDSQTTGELSALEAHARANKQLTQTSLAVVLQVIVKRGQAIAPKPTALPPRRGRPPKNEGMFPG